MKRMVTKLPIFEQNHGLTPLQKCQFCAFLQAMFLLFRKACLRCKTSKIAFSRFIFTMYEMEIQGVTRGYRGLHWVTRGYKGLQRVTGGYKGLQQVTGGDKGLHWVTKDYRNFFLTRTFPDSFSWFILHKNQS